MIDENHPDTGAQIDLEEAIKGQQQAKGEPPRPVVGESITEAEIHAWCDWFSQQGIEASARAIRKERGGKGSPEGIHTHVLTWRAKRDGARAQTQAEAPKAEPQPESRELRSITSLRRAPGAIEALIEAFLADFNEVSAGIQDEAIRDVRAIKADCARQIADIQSAKDAEIKAINDRHDRVVAVMQSDLDEALADSQDLLDQIERPGDGYKAQIAAHAAEIDRLRAQIAQKDAEIATAQAEIDRLRPLEGAVAGLEAALNELGAKYAIMEESLSKAQAEATTQKEDADRQRGIADGLRGDLDQARRDLSVANQTAATAFGKAAGLEEALAATKTVVISQEAEIARLSADLDRVRKERDARTASQTQPQAPQATTDVAPVKSRRKRGDRSEQVEQVEAPAQEPTP